MVIGVLALQGAFIEHEKMLQSLGVTCVELRQKKDLMQKLDGLVLPGGESTVQGKLLKELDMFEDLKEKIENGLPVLATCAGLILLAKEIEGQQESYFQTLPVVVKRNAYGRQLGSFCTTADFGTIGEVPMTFIRVPYVSDTDTEENVEVLAKVDGRIVGVQFEKQLAIAFHPEVGQDTRIHQYFLNMITHEQG